MNLFTKAQNQKIHQRLHSFLKRQHPQALLMGPRSTPKEKEELLKKLGFRNVRRTIISNHYIFIHKKDASNLYHPLLSFLL